MNPTALLLLSITFLTIGAVLSLLLGKMVRVSRQIAGISALFASFLGVFASINAFITKPAAGLTLISLPTFGNLTLNIDSLSILFIAVISLVGLASSFYYLSNAPLNPLMGFFTNLFIAAMLFVVASQNSFFFIVFWELMTLTTYFLVIWKSDSQENVRTGYIYLLVAHAGAALIMVAIFLIYYQTNSFDFSSIRQAQITPSIKNWIFFLALIGFGAKAGMVPLHFWTPDTYALAPHHASALMAGVMKKIAVYGILRFSIDLLGTPEWWWGFVIMIFGVVSTLVGAFYALPELNIKRLLAYSSVENVGIILLGAGLGVMGLGLNQPVLATLGLLAALYHILNHAFFKSLLFLSAGWAIDQTNSMNLNRMGGLRRHMPGIALIFFLGSIAVTAIPPLNGFVSEWFTYQAFFIASKSSLLIIRILTPLFAILMAFAGAIALMVYVKAYSSMFSGPELSKTIRSYRDPNNLTMFSLVLLALGCILLGVGAPWVSPVIAQLAASFTNSSAISVSQGQVIFPGSPSQAVLSPPLVAVLLIGLLAIPLLLILVMGGYRAGKRSNVEPWSCGYGYSPRMSLTAASFYQPVKVNFQPIYWLRSITERPFEVIRGFSNLVREKILLTEPVIEKIVTKPTTRVVETAGQWIQALQMGDIRVYCLYIIITLTILLIAIFGRSGL